MGLTVYRKRGDKYTLLAWHPRKKCWAVHETSYKVTGTCWAVLGCSGPCLPEDGPEGIWGVWDGTTFQLQETVAISIATLQQVKIYDNKVAAAAADLKDIVKIYGFKVNYYCYLLSVIFSHLILL